ncbi:hypothetical protein [Neisseria montereyensis]|uniref:Transposase n=1 Tax=Neisseria montereyensis TaxID=2973938 RepID=A0ABT2FAZ8_9NEIS|nr:hypothetical protein [Neisseria montereyensis]MCS4533318.1 hypothetical protein [Neisseria montereyensis]
MRPSENVSDGLSSLINVVFGLINMSRRRTVACWGGVLGEFDEQ